jgi:hypothetical protein
MQKTLIGPNGWTIELDREELSLPGGEGEPSVLVSPNGDRGTYYAAMNFHECDGKELPEEVVNWINYAEVMVGEFLYED